MMELRGKRILLISPEPWHGLHMSKHHLAQALAARGNAVYFLDPPRPGARAISAQRVGDVTVVRYFHWLRGVNRLPARVNTWYYRRLIRAIAARTGGPFDILWCFDTSRPQAFPEGLGLKLLHLADYDILYTGKGLIPTADLILTTGQVVADAVRDRARCRTVIIGHALDARWTKDAERLAERRRPAVRHALFMGQLANAYNDWEGFTKVVSSHPDIRFTFIGPYDPALPEPAFHALRTLPNAEFTGLKAKDELVPLVRDADLLFFGFRSATHAKERANPHKVLEYLSTGNVVVGSYTMEYAGRDDLMVTAPEGGDLNAAFDLAVERFAELDAPERRLHRIRFALARTMPALIARIENELPR